MATDRYDLAILDSGSTAFAAALRAAEMSKRTVMTEVHTVGGTCVNRGCLPSKNLIEAARLVHDARNPRYPGIEPSQPGLDFGELVRQKDEVISSFREKKYLGIVHGEENIRIVEGRARFTGPHTVSVDGEELAAVDAELGARAAATVDVDAAIRSLCRLSDVYAELEEVAERRRLLGTCLDRLIVHRGGVELHAPPTRRSSSDCGMTGAPTDVRGEVRPAFR